MNDWDDLEDDARAASVSRGPRCSVAVMLEVIHEDFGQDAVTSVLRTLKNHRLTTSSIHKALEKRVTPCDLPSAYSLGRHRKGACSCKELDDE